MISNFELRMTWLAYMITCVCLLLFKFFFGTWISVLVSVAVQFISSKSIDFSLFTSMASLVV